MAIFVAISVHRVTNADMISFHVFLCVPWAISKWFRLSYFTVTSGNAVGVRLPFSANSLVVINARFLSS